MISAAPGTGGAVKILLIDPDANTVSTLATCGATGQRWWGTRMGPDNKIYGIPFTAQNVLEIDTCSNAKFNTNVSLSPYYNKF